MTDTEAIVQINEMKAEALALKSQLTDAQGEVGEALDTLQDVLDNVSTRLSDVQRRVMYVLNNYGE